MSSRECYVCGGRDLELSLTRGGSRACAVCFRVHDLERWKYTVSVDLKRTGGGIFNDGTSGGKTLLQHLVPTAPAYDKAKMAQKVEAEYHAAYERIEKMVARLHAESFLMTVEECQRRSNETLRFWLDNPYTFRKDAFLERVTELSAQKLAEDEDRRILDEVLGLEMDINSPEFRELRAKPLTWSLPRGIWWDESGTVKVDVQLPRTPAHVVVEPDVLHEGRTVSPETEKPQPKEETP